MQLNVLTGGDVGQVARIFARQPADGAQLAGRDDPVRDPDAHHEVVGRQAFAALAARGAYAVALGVNAPPLEVGRSPLGHNTGAARPGKCAHFIERFPWILLALQAFHTLGFGFFFRNGLSHCPSSQFGFLKLRSKNENTRGS